MRLIARRALLCCALAAWACRSDSATSSVNDSATAFWSLNLDYKAITLALVAPYDTFQLTATPRTVSGTAIDTLPAVTFTTSNEDAVLVDATGRLTALQLTPGAMIIASLTANGITHTDTATVAVTDDPAGLLVTFFSMQPDTTVGDSAKFALGGTNLAASFTLLPTLRYSDSSSALGLPVHFKSLDERTLTIDAFTGVLIGNRRGTVPVVGTMTAYGVSFADTVQFTIGYPLYMQLHIYGESYAFVPSVVGTFAPDSVTVGVGAVVEWQNWGFPAVDTMEIVFNYPATLDSTSLDSVPEAFPCTEFGIDCNGIGNIAPYSYPDYDPANPCYDCPDRARVRARRFTAPGVFHYQSPRQGTSGVVAVVQE